MIKRSESKRIFYSSGMISLVLIPALCFWYISENFKIEKLYAINTIFVNKQNVSNDTNKMRIPIPPEREFKTYILNGKKFSNVQVFKKIEKDISKLSNVCDTVHGIHIHFAKKATYAEFIRVIDFCRSNSIDGCIPYKSDIYVVIPNSIPIIKFPHSKYTEMHPCGGNFKSDIVPNAPPDRPAWAPCRSWPGS